MPTLTIEGVGRVTVDDSFTQLPPEEQNKVVEEIAGQANPSARSIYEPMQGERGLGEVASSFYDEQAAALQGTNPVVRNYEGKFTREPLGEVVETDGGTFYKDAQGELKAINAEQDLVMRDPQSGKVLVFAREPENDEGKAVSLFRLMAPAFMTTPLGGTTKAVQPTAKQIRKAEEAARRAALANDFKAADVPVTAPALSTSKSIQGTSKQLSQTVLGGPLHDKLDESIKATGKAVENLADKAGKARAPYDAGAGAQQAIARQATKVTLPGLSANEIAAMPAAKTSFATRASALYDKAYGKLAQNTRGALTDTQAVIDDIVTKRTRALLDPKVGGSVNPGLIERLKSPEARLSVEEMRRLRTDIGSLRGIREANIDGAEIKRLYGALTSDMERLVMQSGGDEALTAFRTADRYYRAGKGRVEGGFKKILNASSPDAAFQKLWNASTSQTSADAGLLASLKQAMRPEEWGDVASTMITRLGRPNPGAAGVDDTFSVANFLTNYNKLQPRAKAVLFSASGKDDLRKALDGLARVANAQKSVEQLANSSRTAASAVNIGSLGSLPAGAATALATGNPTALLVPLAAIGGPYATAKFLASPQAVRWLTRAVELKQRQVPTGAWLTHVAKLRTIAKQAPEMEQALVKFADELGSESTTTADEQQQQN